jgi:AcrR family transcriptional regulator
MSNRGRHAGALETRVPARVHDPRRRVLEAFVQTVAREGYEQMTMDQVLTLAEIPWPVFAEHFEDKQDCMLAALDETLEALKHAVLQRVDVSAPWVEQVRMGLQALLSELSRNPDMARLTLVECLGAGESAIARLRQTLARCATFLEQGRADLDGRERDCLPEQISEAFAGGISSILHRRALEWRTADLPDSLPDLLYFALLPSLGHEQALSVSGCECA